MSSSLQVKNGNGMETKFATPAALQDDGTTHDVGSPSVAVMLAAEDGWDFVVLNDYSQAPSQLVAKGTAKIAPRALGIQVLTTTLHPLIAAAGATTILMETPAYRAHVKGSEQLGTWAEFTSSQTAGYEAYRTALDATVGAARDGVETTREMPWGTKVARVNTAYAVVRNERPELWHDLFCDDDFHPSVLGTYMMACLVYCAVFGAPPPPPPPSRPLEQSTLFARSRIALQVSNVVVCCLVLVCFGSRRLFQMLHTCFACLV
jgi:hypothetical protein